MMKQLLTFFLVISTCLVSAQITIVNTDLGAVGDVIPYAVDTVVTGKMAAPASNNFQTFDYSTNLVANQFGEVKFLSPTSLGLGSQFPNANLAVELLNGTVFIGNKSAAGYYVNGVYGDILNAGAVVSVNFNPSITAMEFPSTYGSSFTTSTLIDTIIEDTFTGLFDSLRIKREMQIISNMDAFGELILPNFSDTVLRTFDVEVTTDSAWGQIFGIWQPVVNSTVTVNKHRFIAKTKGYYVLEAEVDANGNILSANYQLGSGMVAAISSATNPTCHNDADGSASVTATGGQAPFTYAWSNGATTATTNNLSGGNYMVTVTDNLGATAITTAVIVNPDSISIAGTPIPDYGNNSGSIELTISGGTPSYQYLWSNGETSKNIYNLAFGNYQVTVTDANGCTNQANFDVDDITSVNEVNKISSEVVYPNPSQGVFTVKVKGEWTLKVYALNGTLITTKTGSGPQKVTLDQTSTQVVILDLTTPKGTLKGMMQIQH